MSNIKGQITCDHRIGDPIEIFTLLTCPRCNGKGVYGTLAFSANGFVMLSPVDSILQSIKKILTENRRSTGYGFDYSLLRRGVIDPDTLSIVNVEVSRCMSYLQSVQQTEKSRGFVYNPSEEISSIDSITAEQDQTDPRRIIISVVITTVSGQSLPLSVPLKA